MGCSRVESHCSTASAALEPFLPCELRGSAAGRAGGEGAHGSRSHAPAEEYYPGRLHPG